MIDKTSATKEYREKMREAGLRPVTMWLPDIHAPGYVEEIARQCHALMKASDPFDDMYADTDATYLVWSNEHSKWWRAGGFGYCRTLAEAGRYTHTQAMDIAAKAIPGTAQGLGMLPEIPVRLEDVEMMRDRVMAEYPSMPRDLWE